MPADLQRFLTGLTSSATVPVSFGAPSGAPGEVLIGKYGIGKIDDQAVIKSSSEPAVIKEGHPRIQAYGRGISGEGYMAEGVSTKEAGGIDPGDTNRCVLMSPEKALGCSTEAAGNQAAILEKRTAGEQSRARADLSKQQKKLMRAEKALAQSKKPSSIARNTQRVNSFRANVNKHSKTVGNFKALKGVGQVGHVVTAYDAGTKLLNCQPAAALGGATKAVVSGAVGTFVGTAAAGTCSGATAMVGTIACVGGGVAVGMGVSEITGDAIDGAAERTGLNELGATLDGHAQVACDAIQQQVDSITESVKSYAQSAYESLF
jgi:hypothetical protein